MKNGNGMYIEIMEGNNPDTDIPWIAITHGDAVTCLSTQDGWATVTSSTMSFADYAKVYRSWPVLYSTEVGVV